MATNKSTKKTAARKASTEKGRAKQAAAAKSADSKAKHTATLNALAPIAKEINVRFDKAAKLEGDANDHRLAAAIQLAGAKARCEADKLNFKKWAEDNVKQAYETVRKLVVVGQADDPKLALEDMRGKNKVANKKLRDGKTGSRDTDGEATGPAPAKTSTPFEQAEKGLNALDDAVRLNVLSSHADKMGMHVISSAMADELKEYTKSKKKARKTSALAGLKAAFTELKASEQIDFVEFAAEAIGADLELPFAPEVDEEDGGMGDEIDLGDIPEALRAKQAAA